MMLIVMKEHIFRYACTLAEYSICNMTFMFSFSLLGPHLMSPFEKYESRVERPKNCSSVYSGKSMSYLLR